MHINTKPYHKLFYAVSGFLAITSLFFATTTVKADTTGPQNPSALTSTLTGSTTIRLSWTPVGTADYFWIYRSTSGAPTYSDILDIVSGSTVTYLNSGLQPGTSYSYRVRAVKGWTEAALTSAPVTTLTTSGTSGSTGSSGTSPLGTATSFQTTNITTSTITLYWPAFASVDQIKLYRSTQSADSFFTPLTTLSGYTTSYVDGGLTPSTTYYYRITTVKNGTESPLNLSAVTKGSTPIFTYTAPTSISSFIATPQAGSSVILNWSYSGTTVDNFHIFRNSYGSYGTFESVTLVPGTARAFVDSNLQSGATYYYRITSIVNGLETPLANAPQTLATATVDPTAPNIPWWYYYSYSTYNTYPNSNYSGTSYYTTTYPSYVSNLSVAAAGDSQAKLSWTSSGSADSFTIYQSPDNLTYFAVDSVKGATTNYTARYLLAGSRYWFKVTSVRGGSESPLSSASSVTITTTNQASNNASASNTTNTSNTNTERLLIPSRTVSPITFSFPTKQGVISKGNSLPFRYQFKNSVNAKKTILFKEEMITQYGSILDTTTITETVKNRSSITIPANRSTYNLTIGLYTMKVSAYEQTGKNTRYIGENDFHFRVK